MTIDDPQEDIVEGEVTSEANDADATENESLDISVSGADQASALLNLEELIKNHIEAIDKLKLELKTQREMLEDSFNTNPTYHEHMEKVQDVTKAKNSVRSEIAKQPAVATLNQKVKDLRFDMNEKSKTLSDLLQDYHEQTGASSIETRDGKVLEIVSTAKLVRRSS
jgi:predicted RNase H-like nuclease (RuvC/YqgF family)